MTKYLRPLMRRLRLGAKRQTICSGFAMRGRCPFILSQTAERPVDVEDWPSAGASLNRIRQIIAVNLPLGLLVVVIGGSGRYWG